MKKTILTIMVAAMMLVAFTACEQQPINWPQEFKTIAVASTGDSTYLQGDDFDFRGIKVVAVYKDGTSEDIDNSVITVTNGDNLATDQEVNLSYLGSSVVVKPVVVAIDSIEATTTETSVYAKIGGATGSATEKFTGNLTVTAYSADKTISRVLGSDEYTATYDSTAAGDDKAITITAYTKSPATAPTVDVILDTVVNFNIEHAKDYYYVGESKAITTNFEFTPVWASGAETNSSYSGLTIGSDPAGDTDLLYDDTNASGNFVASDLLKTWSATVYLASNESVSKSASLTVSNTYKSIESAVVTTQPTTSLAGQSITASMFTVMATTNAPNATSTAVTSVNDIRLNTATEGATGEGHSSLAVSHLDDAETMNVYVGVAMNGQTVVWSNTPVSVTINPSTGA